MPLFPKALFSKAVTKVEQDAATKVSLEVLPFFPTYRDCFSPPPFIFLWRWNKTLAFCRSFNPTGLP